MRAERGVRKERTADDLELEFTMASFADRCNAEDI